MHFGIDGMGDRAFYHEAAERMANEDRVLPGGAMRFTRGLRHRGDRIVAIEITGKPFRGGFPAEECELISDGPLKRLDLQLLAMVTDARERLAALGHRVNQKILLNGFSASGLFANRFTFLHPEAVAAAAYGGVNAFIMLPVTELDSEPLEFPLGLADFAKISGHPFDRATYAAVPQFAYMGEKDTNDAVVHRDAYSEPDQALIFKLLGQTLIPDRWKAVEAVYQKEHLPVQFRTYESMGHGTDGKINGEVAEFYRGVIEKPH